MNASEEDLLSFFSDNVELRANDGFFITIHRFAVEQPLVFASLFLSLFFLGLLLFPFVGLLGCPLLYSGMIAIYIYYRLKLLVMKGYSKMDEDEGRQAIARWITFVGTIWHGHEVVGTENIPEETALFVLFHGPIPVDGYYLYAKLMQQRQRIIHAVVNKNHYRIPVLRGMLETVNAGPWDQDDCIEILLSGSDMCILPGGKYESRMSDENYRVEWGDRMGFAKVALAARVPIVPVFTKNIQEAFWTPSFAIPFTRGRFSTKKQYVNIIAGGLPVKLTTFIGESIPYDENMSYDELAATTINRLQKLIDTNQPIPGNRQMAFWERFDHCEEHDSQTVTDCSINIDVTEDEEVEEFSVNDSEQPNNIVKWVAGMVRNGLASNGI